MDGAKDPPEPLRKRSWKRVGGGVALLLFGAALVPLPLSGTPFMLGGLGLLSQEIPWVADKRHRTSAWLKAKVNLLKRASGFDREA